MTTKRLCHVLAVSTATAALMAGTAYGAQAGNKSDQPSPPIRVTAVTDPYLSGLKKLANKYSKQTGNPVNVKGYGYTPLHNRDLLACSQHSSKPDVFLIDGIWIGQMTKANCLQGIGSRIDNSSLDWKDFTRSGRAQATWQGTRYCLPVSAYYELLFYRTDLFKKAGIKHPPRTIAQLKKDAAKFTNNPKFKGISGIALNNKRGAAAGQAYFQFLYNFGGRPWESNKIGSKHPYSNMHLRFDSAASKKTVRFFKQMLKYEPSGAESYAWSSRASAFENGSVAMIPAWSVRAQLAANPKKSKIAGKFASTLLPAIKGHKRITPMGGWQMCMNKNSKHKAAAWRFMKWFASKKHLREFVLNGGTPSRISTLKNPKIQKKLPWAKTLLKATHNAYPEIRPRIAPTFQLINIVGKQVNEAITGSKSVDAAMKEAQQKGTQLLKQKGYLNK